MLGSENSFSMYGMPTVYIDDIMHHVIKPSTRCMHTCLLSRLLYSTKLSFVVLDQLHRNYLTSKGLRKKF